MATKDLVSSEDVISMIRNAGGINIAVNSLYKKYYTLLEKFVINNNGTKEDAEDVIQDTMVAFIDMVQREKYRGEAEIGTFLYSITRNIWLAKIRKIKAENNRIENWVALGEQIDVEISKQIERQESLQVIENLFNSLGATCKKILSMFYYEEASIKEILLVVNYENEQVLRNKKAKCMKAITEKIELNPKLKSYLKKALQTQI